MQPPTQESATPSAFWLGGGEGRPFVRTKEEAELDELDWGGGDIGDVLEDAEC